MLYHKGFENNFYSIVIGNWSGGAESDSGIYFEDNLLGVVQDNTDINLISDVEFI